MLTVSEACQLFLTQHDASAARIRLLESMLAKAVEAFGEQDLTQLEPLTLARWRGEMPPPTRWQATQALKQVSAWAARWQLTERDALEALANPRPWSREVRPFEDWAQLERLAAALPEHLRLLPVLGAGCGLRPGELLGLDWDAINLNARVLRVHASVYERELRQTLKTRASRRTVPLRGRVIRQLAAARGAGEARAGGLILRGRAGGPLDLRNLRARAWRPALRAAGIEHPHRIYDLRHTYATWSLRAGVSTFQLARRMGTSIAMIDATYGHLATDADDHERALLDAWDDA